MVLSAEIDGLSFTFNISSYTLHAKVNKGFFKLIVYLVEGKSSEIL